MRKLSVVQERALAKLTYTWQAAFDLGETIGTLNSLANRELAIHRDETLDGEVISPRVRNYYRLLEADER